MDRRVFMGSLGAYGSLLAGARGQGTSRAPKLKIREIRAVRMRGINSRFVRVYTDQGLTGTGELSTRSGRKTSSTSSSVPA